MLDLIFSTNDGLVRKVHSGPELITSDSKIVSFNINLKVNKENVSKELVFIYRKGNFEKLRDFVR